MMPTPMTLGNMRQNGVRLAPLLFAASLLAESVQAQSLSQQDLDLSCAIASGAEMGANPKGSAERSELSKVQCWRIEPVRERQTSIDHKRGASHVA